MKQYNLLNIIVGLLFILLIIVLFNLNFSSFQNKYNTYTIYLDTADGIKNNTEINIGGRKVGFVNKINLDKNNNAYIEAFILKNINIPTDSIFFVGVPSLFSNNKYINIVMGINEDYLTNNAVIYNSNIGLDLNKMLDLISIYLKTLTNENNKNAK